MEKPTIVVVPGAWHTPQHFEALLTELQSLGYPVASQQLPSVGADNPRDKDVTADASFIRQNVLLPEIDQGKEVVLVMHSYGGCPGGAAAKGLSKTERSATNNKGGIVGLIFICAFVASEGDSLVSKNPDKKLHPWIVVDETSGQVEPGDPETIFYNGLDESATQKAVAELKQHSHLSLLTPSPPTAWPDKAFDGRRAYIKCHQDNAIPIVAQNAMVSFSGVEWLELNLTDAGHSPFLTHLKPVVGFIDGLAEKWTN